MSLEWQCELNIIFFINLGVDRVARNVTVSKV